MPAEPAVDLPGASAAGIDTGAPAPAARPPVPFVVIGGYLGSGKTTLLNRVLRNTQGLRAAVLVNDFGSVNIDADLIASADNTTINLANGCICCSLQSGFMKVIWQLQVMTPAPDVVIIEASGVANPMRVASYGYYPGFSYEGIVVLVDAETIRTRAADDYVGSSVLRQLQMADLLVLAKTDLVSPAEADAVEAWLRETVEGARIIRANHGELPLDAILGVAGGRRAPSPEEAAGETHALHETFSISSAEPIEREALAALAGSLPDGVIRAKGSLRLAESPETRQVFQLVGKRWEIDPAGAWNPGEASRLVFIGLPGSIERGASLAALPGAAEA
ncbi:MAG: CobW family GTP-binding protein [Chloroflexota bacterium]